MAFSWILIVAVLLIIFFLLKAKEMRHRLATVVIIALLIFIVFTFSKVASLPNVDFKTLDGILNVGKLYFIWLRHIGGNLVGITGNAIKMDWGTNFSNLSR